MDDKWSTLEKYNLWNGNSYKLGLLRTSYINKKAAGCGIIRIVRRTTDKGVPRGTSMSHLWCDK